MTQEQYDNCMKLVAALRQLSPDDPRPVYFTKVEGDGNFLWNFNQISTPVTREKGCGTMGCAIGLGIKLGLFESPDDVSITLGVSERWLERFFWAATGYPKAEGFRINVTPRMVADALERRANLGKPRDA